MKRLGHLACFKLPCLIETTHAGETNWWLFRAIRFHSVKVDASKVKNTKKTKIICISQVTQSDE